MKKIIKFLKKRSALLVIIVSAVSSIMAYFLSVKMDYSLAYNDAMSHLNIARLVFDCMEPSFAQLGSVWLPLNHILYLTLIWNDWAWQSGFAGSIFSMLAYVISAWGIYQIIIFVTKNKIASVLGALVFALNLNMLYLQTTPLTEPLYILFFILSSLYFAKWIKLEDPKYLFLIGFFGFLQVLTRYDGWFVVGIEGLLLLFNELFYRRDGWKNILGKAIIFSFPIIFGIGLWFLWNFLIYGDPLYFIFGPYSARAQQSAIESNSGLITKGDMWISCFAFFYDVVSNIGRYILGLSFFGVLIFFIKIKWGIIAKEYLLLFILLCSPILFNVISLYLGFSIINIPELNWNPSGEFSGQWFNVRYGILALPFVSFFMGMLFSVRKKYILVVGILIIIAQSFLTFNEGIISLIDGTIGSSSFANKDIATELNKNVKRDEKIIMSTSFFNAVSFRSGVHLKQFIHEGVKKQWDYALISPEDYATWIVIANGDVGEPVYESLVKKQKGGYLYFYKLYFKGKHSSIYRLRNDNEFYISTRDIKFINGKKDFLIKGVNSYDLAYRSEDEIDEIFRSFSDVGVNTVRFWLFGDGNDNGFQTTAGIINEERFTRVDKIIAKANEYDIKLVPVLVNNWEDYGGKKQYLRWTGNDINNEDLFFYDEKTIELFKNYINHVISRRNTVTNNLYSEEFSILSWEIMNEPRLSGDDKEVLAKWTADISSYIKSIDVNHLVSIGSEKNDNDICSISDIDFCSAHLYIFNEDQALFNNVEEIRDSIALQSSFSHKLGKPIVIGEFGISKTHNPFNMNPIDVMSDLKDKIFSSGYSGIIIWNWSLYPDDSFGFSFFGDENHKYNAEDIKNILK